MKILLNNLFLSKILVNSIKKVRNKESKYKEKVEKSFYKDFCFIFDLFSYLLISILLGKIFFRLFINIFGNNIIEKI